MVPKTLASCLQQSTKLLRSALESWKALPGLFCHDMHDFCPELARLSEYSKATVISSPGLSWRSISMDVAAHLQLLRKVATALTKPSGSSYMGICPHRGIMVARAPGMRA